MGTYSTLAPRRRTPVFDSPQLLHTDRGAVTCRSYQPGASHLHHLPGLPGWVPPHVRQVTRVMVGDFGFGGSVACPIVGSTTAHLSAAGRVVWLDAGPEGSTCPPAALWGVRGRPRPGDMRGTRVTSTSTPIQHVLSSSRRRLAARPSAASHSTQLYQPAVTWLALLVVWAEARVLPSCQPRASARHQSLRQRSALHQSCARWVQRALARRRLRSSSPWSARLLTHALLWLV